MPQNCQPARLEVLAIGALGELVKMLGQNLMEPFYLISQRDPNRGLMFLQHSLDYIKETFWATVPVGLLDKVAMQVVTSVSQMVNEIQSDFNNYISMAAVVNKVKVAVHLTKIAIHPKLKEIVVSNWPKMTRHVLHHNLSKLKGLETLDLGSASSGTDTLETEKYVLSGVQWMSNLTTFRLHYDCTDNIISVLGRSCQKLKILDVASSKSVTDYSIPFIFNLKHLSTVQLACTSVSAESYTKLLSELPSIEDLGSCYIFGQVLQMLQGNISDPLPLKSLRCERLTDEQFRLLHKFCPRLILKEYVAGLVGAPMV